MRQGGAAGCKMEAQCKGGVRVDGVASLIVTFEQIELQAKLLNYFLGSNKSNINRRERGAACSG